MGDFTPINCGLWDWEPFISLPPRERVLWLALYTSGTAKRICPGLWHGGIHTMAHEAKMQADDTWAALDELIKRKVVEYDGRLCVLRMIELPDGGDRPTSWKALKGMWNRFRSVPICYVRDAYVPLMRWLIDAGPVTDAMEQEWSQTFATIAVRKPIPSQPLANSDTSTSVQPSLFPSKAIARTDTPSDTPSYGLPIPLGSDQERDQVRDQVPVQVPDQDPLVGKVIPFVHPDARRAEQRGQIMREIGPAHAQAFQLVRSELKIQVPAMSVIGHYTELADYLDALPTLDDALDRCRHLLAVREHEARKKRTLAFFGKQMWSPTLVRWAESKSIDDIDRECAPRQQQATGVGRFEPVDVEQFGPTGDLEL